MSFNNVVTWYAGKEVDPGKVMGVTALPGWEVKLDASGMPLGEMLAMRLCPARSPCLPSRRGSVKE